MQAIVISGTQDEYYNEKCAHCGKRTRSGQTILMESQGRGVYVDRELFWHSTCVLSVLENSEALSSPPEVSAEEMQEAISTLYTMGVSVDGAEVLPDAIRRSIDVLGDAGIKIDENEALRGIIRQIKAEQRAEVTAARAEMGTPEPSPEITELFPEIPDVLESPPPWEKLDWDIESEEVLADSGEATCWLCRRVFQRRWLPPNAATTYGYGYRFCPSCVSLLHALHPAARPRSRPYPDRALIVLSDLIEMPPMLPFVVPWDALGEERGAMVAAAIACCDSLNGYFDRHGRPWTRVLQTLDILAESHRTKRGVVSAARDGHWCRSLAERAIDDFLFARHIPHEPEPLWPSHQSLNPSGRLRGDWLLADGTYVEFAGMLDDPRYFERFKVKKSLAASSQIRLLVVTPIDLNALDVVFQDWIPGH